MTNFKKGVPEMVENYRGRAIKFYGMDGDGIQAPGAIVLMDLGIAQYHRYAVWFANTQTGGYSAGDYSKTREEAEQDYAKKLTRYDPTGQLNQSFNGFRVES